MARDDHNIDCKVASAPSEDLNNASYAILYILTNRGRPVQLLMAWTDWFRPLQFALTYCRLYYVNGYVYVLRTKD